VAYLRGVKQVSPAKTVIDLNHKNVHIDQKGLVPFIRVAHFFNFFELPTLPSGAKCLVLAQVDPQKRGSHY